MEHRPPLSGQRPHPTQRAVSGDTFPLSQRSFQRQPPALSRLSQVRSVSQPSNVVDLTSDGTQRERNNAAAFLGNREQVVQSPDNITFEDGDGEPPAKRAKISGDGFRVEGKSVVGEDADKASQVRPGSPLPTLPKTKASTKRFTGSRRYRFGIDPSSRKSHNLEPPAIATRVPPPKKAVDFSPWTGNHPEDQLNESVIKTGFFDKLQSTNQQESTSAKSTIWPNLSQKNHPGLSLLSHVFTAVLEKRQSVGKVTVPSTFKPPPRVTVTDTKREAWLRDLANPEIPLRKQSRTIPHGIRGKLLMDQCMSKAIPLQRAVWLAKCVGANELRAFKRKGVSGAAAANGESKWVQDWTVSVKQYLESVIAMCGQKEWERKIRYAIKLTTAFHNEGLLDTDHFLDWIVESLANATLDRLPIWIVMVQIYWKDITMYGKRGRKLTGTILEHLHQLTVAGLERHAFWRLRLQKLIAILAVSSRGCLIVPRVWEKYNYLLAPKTASSAKDTPAENIARRNERLAAPLSKSASNTRSGILDLFAELDSIRLVVGIPQLAKKAADLVKDVYKLVAGLLDWASTPYRVGTSRIYLAAAIIAHQNQTGEDTDAAILQYLGDENDLTECSANSLHRIVVELVRLQSFSIGRYFQWLITSGLLSNPAEFTWATNLIAALPTQGLPLHVINTRKTIMARLGHPIDENVQISKVLNDISEAMERSLVDFVGPVEIPERLTTSARLSISGEVCEKVSVMAKDVGIGVQAFGLARDLIERIGDIKSLANLVRGMLASDNLTLLATVTDTVAYHAETFAALGQFSHLVDGLSEQYVHLRSQQPLERPFIVGLLGLARRMPEKAALVKLLTEDLALSEQQSTIAVCSPASDSLIGMHASSLDSDDDIDAVFASGNTMDEQLMQRVFTRIIQRSSRNPPPGVGPISRTCGWLDQLRAVDQSGVFDRIIQSYVRSLVEVTKQRVLDANIISYLVAAGCLGLETFAKTIRELDSPMVSYKSLPIFLAAPLAGGELSDIERYRFSLQQKSCQTQHADLLIELVRMSCDAQDFEPQNPAVLKLFIRCVQVRPGSVLRIFEEGKSSQMLRANAGRMIMAILQGGDTATQDGDMNLRSLIRIADPLSITFSIGALRYFKSLDSFASKDEVDLGDAILEAFKTGSEVWSKLLEVSGPVVNEHMCEWAQGQLLSVAAVTDGCNTESTRDEVQRLLDLLAVTSGHATGSADTSSISTVTERLKDLDRQISTDDEFGSVSNRQMITWMHHLDIILHLCVMHVHDPPNDTDASRQSKSNMLLILCSLLMHPKLQTHPEVVEYLSDLSSLLSENLPNAWQLLPKIQNTAKTQTDARLTFIFGPNSSIADSWLALASRIHPTGSQQQKALNKHSLQQQQQSDGGRPSPTSHSSQQQHQRVTSQGGPGMLRHDGRAQAEVKINPFALRKWEIIPDATPVLSENDVSLSLGLFGARKV